LLLRIERAIDELLHTTEGRELARRVMQGSPQVLIANGRSLRLRLRSARVPTGGAAGTTWSGAQIKVHAQRDE